MARRRNSSRHNRRGRFVFLYKVLSMLVICAAIIAAVTLFFRVNRVVASGQVRYEPQEICDASGVEIGQNLFLLNKYDVAGAISTQLPYIETITIHRKYPDTLFIEVTECAEPFSLEQDDCAWLISTKGKIVDCVSVEEGKNYTPISGCELLNPAVGSKIVLSAEYASRQKSLLDLMEAIEAADVLEKVDGIRLGDISTLYLDYDGRFTVKLPYEADYGFKLYALNSYFVQTDAIQDNMSGTFDMQTDEDHTYFKPNVR